MSLETWKKEFVGPMRKTPKGVVKRDLKKWRGLVIGNLERHSVKAGLFGINDKQNPSNCAYEIDGGDCNCCQLSGTWVSGDCRKCPLYQTRGKRCDRPIGESPWSDWTRHNDPTQMIKLLECTLKRLS